MKKIITASLLLSAVSYGASDYLARKGREAQRVAADLPASPITLAEVPVAKGPQCEVEDLDTTPNSDIRPVKSDPDKIEPIDPVRRECADEALVYKSASRVLRHGVWLFPLLGVALIVWRKLEEARVRRLLQRIERESATPEVVRENP